MWRLVSAAVLAAVASHAATSEEPPPHKARKNPWKKFLKEHVPTSTGGTGHVINAPGLDVAAAKRHASASEDAVEAAVEAEHEEDSVPKDGWQPTKTTRSLIAHYAQKKEDAPAPAPAPAPGPAPWTDDPEWYIDGKRGDKTQTAPIPEEVVRGSVLDAHPEDGYHGRPVKHVDLKTMTSDWRSEFGKTGPESAFKACMKHRESYWCKKHIRELQWGETEGDYAPGGRYGPEKFTEQAPPAPAPRPPVNDDLDQGPGCPGGAPRDADGRCPGSPRSAAGRQHAGPGAGAVGAAALIALLLRCSA